MLSTFIGLLAVLGGIWGLVYWWSEFCFVVRGFLPISVLLGGVLTAIAGISSLTATKPVKKEKQEDTPSSPS